MKYCEKTYERSGKNLFWSIKDSGEVLDKLKAKDFNATKLTPYDFSYSFHYFASINLLILLKEPSTKKGSPYLACSDRNAFLLRKRLKISCMVLSKCI